MKAVPLGFVPLATAAVHVGLWALVIVSAS